MNSNKPISLFLEPGNYFWCTCGKTNTPPFCDNQHIGTKFKPIKKTISKAGTVSWCNCKLTNEPPFCDGSHSRQHY